MTIYYAGIGSRNTPESVLDGFTELAYELAQRDCTLRSGRADGADSAFEEGCLNAMGKSEIYIPRHGFNSHSMLSTLPAIALTELSADFLHTAMESVVRYHPAPSRLSHGAKLLMVRNYCQLHGDSQKAPMTDFVVCYTSSGKASGGTGQAIRMAEDLSIKVFNAHGFENSMSIFNESVMHYVKEVRIHERIFCRN